MASVRRIDAGKPVSASANELLDRKPPYNLEAETCVLGSMMLNSDVCDDVALIIREDDFYDDANRLLSVIYPDGTPYQTREEYLEARHGRTPRSTPRHTRPIERYIAHIDELSPQGRRVVHLLAANNWSLKRLSFEAGVSLQTIHKVLRKGLFSPKLDGALGRLESPGGKEGC